MGERKVLNKCYPPDFDPAKIPGRKQPENQKIDMLLPMNIRCNTCGNYMYNGTKLFNAHEEDVKGETYLGIQIFRFSFKCTNCSASLTMKTDPQNSDYIMETGASRDYEPWRVTDERQKLGAENEAPGQAAGILSTNQAQEAKGATKPPSYLMALLKNPVEFNGKPKVTGVVSTSTTKEAKKKGPVVAQGDRYLLCNRWWDPPPAPAGPVGSGPRRVRVYPSGVSPTR